MAEEFLKKAVVSITCGTADATVKYTTDGTDPSDSVGTEYSASFDLWQNATVKAIGIKDGMTNSDIASKEYTVKLPTPVLLQSVEGDEATVTISNLADFADHYGDVVYHYTTDGSDPDAEDPVFTSGMAIAENCTVKVIATATNNVTSDAGSIVISTMKVDTPVITAVAG